MTTMRIEILLCDAASCPASARADTEGWFAKPYVAGCPAHAEIVAAHESRLSYDTRGRGSRETTTVSLACSCGWIPATRWTHGSVSPLVAEHLAHVREMTIPTTEETPNHG